MISPSVFAIAVFISVSGGVTGQSGMSCLSNCHCTSDLVALVAEVTLAAEPILQGWHFSVCIVQALLLAVSLFCLQIDLSLWSPYVIGQTINIFMLFLLLSFFLLA